jgi:hypothetical protein
VDAWAWFLKSCRNSCGKSWTRPGACVGYFESDITQEQYRLVVLRALSEFAG